MDNKGGQGRRAPWLQSRKSLTHFSPSHPNYRAVVTPCTAEPQTLDRSAFQVTSSP